MIRTMILALLPLLALGCRSEPDRCGEFAKKTWHLLPAVSPTKLTKDEFIRSCQAVEKQGLPNPQRTELFRCVHVASTDALVTKCLEAAQKAFGDAAADQFFGELEGAMRERFPNADIKHTDDTGVTDVQPQMDKLREEMRRSYQEGSSR